MARAKQTDIVEEATTAVAAIDQQNKDLAPYLAGDSYNYDRLVEEVEFFNQQHMRSGFEIGRRLIVLKETLPHGQFGTQVLERVKIGASHASRLMAFARTVVELAETSKGALDFDRLKQMDHRKVELLGDLAEENLEELEATGTISGRTLDEYDAMSRKQLAETVRRQQAQIDKGREQLNAEKERFNRKAQSYDDLMAGDSNAIVISTGIVLGKLRDALTAFDTTGISEGGSVSPAAATAICGMRAELRKFYDSMLTMIDERFPDVHEVPEDMDLTAGESSPPPAKSRKAKVIDAVE